MTESIKQVDKQYRLHKPDGAGLIKVAWLSDLNICIITSETQYKDLIETYDLQESGFADLWETSNAFATCLSLEKIAFFVMGFPHYPKIDQELMVHECVHMCHYIFDELGMPITIDNSESVAYMTAYLYKQVHRVLNGLE